MINITPDIIKAFADEGLIIIHENQIDSRAGIPCVTYSEYGNTETRVGDTAGYSLVRYTVSVWAGKYAELVKISQQADRIMKRQQFIRSSAAEQTERSGLYRKILIYERLIKEIY